MSSEQVASSIDNAEPVQPSEERIELTSSGMTAKEALLRLIDETECWRTLDGIVYATVHVDGHQERLAVASKEFRDWLLNQLQRRYSRKGRPASASEQAVREARAYAEAKVLQRRQMSSGLARYGRRERHLH